MRTPAVRPLPRSGLALPRFGLGCSAMGGLHGRMGAAEAAGLVEAAFELGVTCFDTAPYYGYTTSERRLGAALAERERSSYVLSTKVGRRLVPTLSPAPGAGGWHEAGPFLPVYDYTRDGVLRSFEDSLQRLGVSGIDLLLVHDIGRRTHGERHDAYWEQLTRGGGWRAMESLRAQGWVKAIGVGVNECEVVNDCLEEADLDCVMLAGRYTLLDHAGAIPLMDRCAQRGIGVLVAGLFNSGVLAGGSTFDYGPAPQAVRRRVDALQRTCAEFRVPLRAAALQFPLAHAAAACCVVGAHAAAELAENVADMNRDLPTAFWHALQERGLVDERAPLTQPRAALTG